MAHDQAHAQPPAQTVDAKSDYHAHVMSMPALIATFAALLILTGLTVAVTWIDLGAAGNISIALAIALVKASLVALYFMHLRYDSVFNSIILICALLFIAIFMAISIIDTAEYQPARDPYPGPQPQPQAEAGG